MRECISFNLLLFFLVCHVSMHAMTEQEQFDTYGDFYKKMALQQVEHIVQDQVKYSDNNSSVLSEILSHDDTMTIKNISWRASDIILRHQTYFLTKPQVVQKSDDELTITFVSHPKQKDHIGVNLIELSKKHEDPVQFLIDHQEYLGRYSCERTQALSILAQSYNLQKLHVFDTLKKIIQTCNFGSDDAALLTGLGNALLHPALKDEAKLLLMQLSDKDLCRYKLGYHEPREIVWQKLKTIMHETDVQDHFLKISQEDKHLADRFKVRNYLDNIDNCNNNFMVERLKRVIATFDIGNLDGNEGKTLDYILWNKGSLGFQALCEFDELHFTQKILDQFKQKNIVPAIYLTSSRGRTPLGGFSAGRTETAHLYSILKFIAINTRNQNNFTEIVTTLIARCHNQDLGVLQSLSQVLAELAKNSHVTMPDIQCEISNYCHDKPDSAFSPMSRDTDYERYRKKKVRALIDIIQDTALDSNVRKLAIRNTAKYIYPNKDEYPWVKDRYKGHADEIRPALENIIADESIDQSMKNEVLCLLDPSMLNDQTPGL